MEIIILFAIVGIISSIIKNAAAKTQQPPPIVYRKPFQEAAGEPVSLESTSMEAAEPQWKRQEELFAVPNPYTVAPSRYRDDSSDTFTSSMDESEPLRVLSLDGTERKQHELDFSESGLLNGIILSEILSPPKALRK